MSNCMKCIYNNQCGIDIFFMDELDLSDEERFKLHCVYCSCGDGLECNYNKQLEDCENFEEEE